MKRLAIILGAAVILAVGALMVGRTAPRISPARAATTTDITFVEPLCGDPGTHCKTVAVKGKGQPPFGSRLLFSLPVRSGGAIIAREQGECSYLNPASAQFYCTYNLRFNNGTVSVQGPQPTGSGGGSAIPVTGGTGAYEGAYGHLTELAPVSGHARYQLHIITP